MTWTPAIVRHHKAITPYLFILPMILGLLLFRIGPILASLGISLTEWNIRTAPEWLGLGNYIEMAQSPIFWQVVRNTLVFAVLTVMGTMILALVMALLLNQKLRGIVFFRGLYFLPYITSIVAVGLTFNWLFSTRFGLVNSLLRDVLGVTGPPAWLADQRYTLLVLVLVSVWKNVGFQMMIFLAGLQSIPAYLYEAARIDGANRWQMFWRITMPLLSPVTFLILIVSIIDAFKTFEITYTMTEGGPNFASTTLAYYIYLNAFIYQRMGFASSLASVLVLMIAAVTVINFAIRRRIVVQDVY